MASKIVRLFMYFGTLATWQNTWEFKHSSSNSILSHITFLPQPYTHPSSLRFSLIHQEHFATFNVTATYQSKNKHPLTLPISSTTCISPPAINLNQHPWTRKSPCSDANSPRKPPQKHAFITFILRLYYYSLRPHPARASFPAIQNIILSSPSSPNNVAQPTTPLYSVSV